MWSGRVAFENDACPVGDDLLGQLYRANENGLPALVASVAPDIRAMLALYCYRRSHLHSLGIAIAGSCEQRDLVNMGGRVGSTLFKISRQTPARTTSTSHRRSVTLSTAPLSALPVMDELDDDLAAAESASA